MSGLFAAINALAREVADVSGSGNVELVLPDAAFSRLMSEAKELWAYAAAPPVHGLARGEVALNYHGPSGLIVIKRGGKT